MPSGCPLGIDSFGSNCVRRDRVDSSRLVGCQGRIENWPLVRTHRLQIWLFIEAVMTDVLSMVKPGCEASLSIIQRKLSAGSSRTFAPNAFLKSRSSSLEAPTGATLPTPPSPAPNAFPLPHSSSSPGIIFKLVVGQQNVYSTKNRSTQITTFL